MAKCVRIVEALYLVLILLLVCCSNPTGPGKGVLRVTVLDDFHSPVSTATVSLIRTDDVDVTDTQGQVIFGDIRAGMHSLTVIGTGFNLVYSSVEVAAGDTTDHTVEIIRGRGRLHIEVIDDWTSDPLTGIQVAVIRNCDSTVVFRGVSDEEGCLQTQPLAAVDVTVRSEAGFPFKGVTEQTTIDRDWEVRVRLREERLISEFSGDIQFCCPVHIPQFNPINILYAVEQEGDFDLATGPIPFNESYTITTDQNGYLVVTALGNASPYEFLLASSPIYDCTGGHMKVEVPKLYGWISEAEPRDSALFSTDLSNLRLKCTRRYEGIPYCEWQVYSWTEVGGGEWVYELVWYTGYLYASAWADWNLRDMESRRVEATSAGSYYSWILIDIYNDGRGRVTQDYFFRLTSDSASLGRVVPSVDPSLRQTAVRSAQARYAETLTRRRIR